MGGVLALWVTGTPFSISAAVGFISVFGVAVQDGVLLISYFNQLRAAGLPCRESVMRGAELRVRPVVMTSLTAALRALARRAGELDRLAGAEATGHRGGRCDALLTLFLTRYLMPVLCSFFPAPRRDVVPCRGDELDRRFALHGLAVPAPRRSAWRRQWPRPRSHECGCRCPAELRVSGGGDQGDQRVMKTKWVAAIGGGLCSPPGHCSRSMRAWGRAEDAWKRLTFGHAPRRRAKFRGKSPLGHHRPGRPGTGSIYRLQAGAVTSSACGLSWSSSSQSRRSFARRSDRLRPGHAHRGADDVRQLRRQGARRSWQRGYRYILCSSSIATRWPRPSRLRGGVQPADRDKKVLDYKVPWPRRARSPARSSPEVENDEHWELAGDEAGQGQAAFARPVRSEIEAAVRPRTASAGARMQARSVADGARLGPRGCPGELLQHGR